MSLRPSWIVFGWFIGAAVSALVIFALTAVGIGSTEGTYDTLDPWVMVALAAGFGIGGFFAGVRAGTSPLLHGLGIGAVSLVVWLGANLLFGEVADLASWTALTFSAATMLFVVHTAAAVVGASSGVQWRNRRVERPS